MPLNRAGSRYKSCSYDATNRDVVQPFLADGELHRLLPRVEQTRMRGARSRLGSCQG